MPGAPVDWCRRIVKRGTARGLVVNSGNANVFTGQAGHDAVAATAATAARALGCRRDDVYVASTGVIGEVLPTERITAALPKLHGKLSDTAWAKAARAIATTDTFYKAASATAVIDGKPVTISGIAKGSGMIAPDMATMLAFVFTDAKLPAPVVKSLLRQANARSFNTITVDSDTSTSDTVLLFATGKARHEPVAKASDPRLKAFKAALETVMGDLARQVVRDGEGATKFITVTVTGAEDTEAARGIARAIANSPLVKTAVAGEDANWGRIVMAVGKSGINANRDKLRLTIGGVLVARDGARYEDYNEADVVPHMKGDEIDIAVDVGVGNGRATVWTCDLTHGYISINADYRS
jgi:glutamate N-acetyltransferase/amino-acid N-acetyltransferase